MQLIRWREMNGLSVREAAKLFGIASPGNLSEIERGLVFASPEVMLRVEHITGLVGPNPVLSDDHLEAWTSAHPQESAAQRAAGRAAVKAFKTAAGTRPKEGPNGKRESQRQ